jgi:uncharacterized surface protein with fasciclin (FAS1) repeats
MKTRIIHISLLSLLFALLFTGCKKWDDHNAITDPALTKNLFEQIKETPDLSKFAELLVASGYDKVIATSKTFTVFAPTNTALAGLDPAIIKDSAQLNKFVGNHIANQSYFLSAALVKQRIAMLNGKNNNLFSTGIENATVLQANQYAKNGVVHVIDKFVPYLENIWTAMEKSTTIPQAQKNYLLSLFRNVFDTTNAIQIGVNPNTGQPIYQPGTDSVRTNLYWRNVYDLRNETKEYSFFILEDAPFASEINKFKPYFVTGTVDSTTNLSSWSVVKDLAVEGVYTTATLPDTLISKFGVKVPVEKASIAQTIKTSNGNIYIMKKVDVKPVHKIQQFFIEGENYSGTSINRRSNTYFRDRFNPTTNKDYKDVMVYNHGVALFNINYRLSNVYSVKYKAYWVAVNDFQAATFTQKLGIGTAASTTFPYTNVVANVYTEVYIGEFTVASYQSFMDIFLVAANSGTAAVNPLVCDYIRLEPVVF